MTNAGDRLPFLFLLGVEPPLSVKGLGKMTLHEAIRLYLPAVLERAGNTGFSEDDLMFRIDDVVCWISWATLASTIKSQMESFSCGDPSTDAAVQRLGNQVTSAIAWHS
ncbi:hypothetical protein ACX80U_03875 [Arthrobacter sp. TmT3-37]